MMNQSMWNLKKKHPFRNGCLGCHASILFLIQNKQIINQGNQDSTNKLLVGGGFKMFHVCCLFTPKIGEDSHVWLIFFKWVETTNQKNNEVIHFVFSLLAVWISCTSIVDIPLKDPGLLVTDSWRIHLVSWSLHTSYWHSEKEFP